ncbi:hypothetical protein BMETH_2438_0 [methanotrophic bacterial endosymbiont of Bathymodiolus sp.]|nr:hypothetical protein BMETH_2438_0 [methanotrophic bacterial endosymbiont of Bathymodiolus sp.]
MSANICFARIRVPLPSLPIAIVKSDKSAICSIFLCLPRKIHKGS